MKDRKGIILAGGTGSRLYPATIGLSKQMLPVYDKPMIYYPLSVLMLAGMREIALITTPEDKAQFQRVLGDGSQWGLSLHYIEQPRPDGLAQAYLLAETFLDGHPSAMILGDNLFFGHGLPEKLTLASRWAHGATIFSYNVADPCRYGILEFDQDGEVSSIVEKPVTPPSQQAVTGLYFFDETAPDRARSITPSARGELEITSLIESYLTESGLEVSPLGRGYAWFDMGTASDLLDAGNFVRTLSERQGVQLGCPEEIAFSKGWMSEAMLRARAERNASSTYGNYLTRLIRGPDPIREDRNAPIWSQQENVIFINRDGA